MSNEIVPISQSIEQRDEAAVARATQEIQAALTIGQRFPRNEVQVKAKILEACKRKELAEVSEYEYSRGGTRITGPTIDLLRAIANRWGNIRYGWTEVDRRDGQSVIRCFAWDLQTNGQAERTFNIKHWRDTQSGGYALKDERDIYELLANMAARRVRACLEEVIDSDIVTAAIDQCHETLKTGEKTPLADRAVQMVAAFADLGVTQPMIESKLGNKLDAVSENQIASLRRIFKSMKDGVGKREDYFKDPKFDPKKVEPKGGKPSDDHPPGLEPKPGNVGNMPTGGEDDDAELKAEIAANKLKSEAKAREEAEAKRIEDEKAKATAAAASTPRNPPPTAKAKAPDWNSERDKPLLLEKLKAAGCTQAQLGMYLKESFLVESATTIDIAEGICPKTLAKVLFKFDTIVADISKQPGKSAV